MPNDSYKTFRVSVRPARVTCLIDINDQNWQDGVLAIIESFSRTWGGAYFIIVPTDGQTISDAFWRILLAYDPDYLWVYDATPDNHYEQSLTISDGLLQELKLRLAPFHLHEHVIQGTAYLNFVPSFPDTDVITIIPNCEHPSNMVEVSNLEGIMQVWTASVTGRASTGYKEALETVGIGNRVVDYNTRLPDLFSLVLDGIRGPLEEDGAGFPYALSLSQLGFYRSWKSQHRQKATLVIVGETLQDFCLYYCLTRLRDRVMWLLPSWFPADGEDVVPIWLNQTPLGCFSRSLSSLTERHRERNDIYLLSLSLSAEDLGSVRNLFNQGRHGFRIQDGFPMGNNPPPDENVQVSLSASLEYLLRFPFRVYESGNVDKIVSRHFFGEDMAGFFETPKPKNFSYIPPYDHRWITDISAIGHTLPRHHLLGEHIVRSATLSSLGVRAGREGIAYFCPNSAYIGGDIDQTLVKPSISLPDCFNIFERLLKDVNYNCQLSDKGRFTLGTLSKFGSLSALAYFLLRDRKRAVLEKYLDHKSPAADARDEGLFLQSDRRRYLDFRAVNRIMGSDESAADLLDVLIGQSVIHRGLILKCEFCRSTDWFSVAELTNEFRCKRCSRPQIYRQFHALSKLEPAWYYKLDEIVFKALANDMVVPLLTLHQLNRGAESFLFSLDIELLDPTSGKQLSELDVCCIPDGELTIGEAKRNNRLGRTAREEREEVIKYFDLAQKIGASQVVFATYSEQWRDETVRMIMERFFDSLIKVILWTKNDLCKHS